MRGGQPAGRALKDSLPVAGGPVGPEEVPPAGPPVRLSDVVIIGGGCYGTFYAKQLESAKSKGKAEYQRILVVDRDPNCQMIREIGETEDRRLIVRDWGDFLDEYLPARPPARQPADVIVPSPLMPHLMYLWLVRRARGRWPGRTIETHPIPHGPGTPYDVGAPDHTRYVSFADWICPTHCIEPAICPAIHGPRTWEMSEALERLARRLDRDTCTVGPVLFTCQHQVFGVGTFSIDQVLAGDTSVEEAGASGAAVDVLVGTVSSCHGAVNLLHLGPT